MSKERLIVSEMFYSLQGEGPSIGHPAVFLRLAACNLECAGFSYRAPETGEHLGCDTKLVWKKGKPHTFEQIINEWQTQGWLEAFTYGAHLVITGGEPLLQQEKVAAFASYLAPYLPPHPRSLSPEGRGMASSHHPRSFSLEGRGMASSPNPQSHSPEGLMMTSFSPPGRRWRAAPDEGANPSPYHEKTNPSPYIEIETNGTILPNEFLSQRVNQFNVSPKLSSSLEPREKAYRPEVLQHYANLPQAIFKFVIQHKKDVDEVIEQYQKQFNIDHQRIWLMPEGGSLKEMQSKMVMLAELCKQHHFNFSPRLHIHIWDEATGV
jgi:organic radical activating enzyme